MRIALTAISLLAAASIAQASVTTVTDATAAQARSSLIAENLVAQLKTLGASGKTDALTKELRLLVDDGELPQLVREQALFEGTLALASNPPTDAAHELVTALADRPVTVQIELHEGPQSVAPLYDVGAAARFVMKRWSTNTRAQDYAQDLATSSARLTSLLARNRDPAALAAALLLVTDATLREYRHELLTELGARPALAAVGLVAAMRLRDEQLLSAVIAHGDQITALDAIAYGAREFSAASARAALDAGLERNELVSAIVNALAIHHGDSPLAQELAFALLGHARHGGSAAAALSRIDDPNVGVRLADMLPGADTLLRARIVLALQLNNSAAAREHLRRYSESRSTPSALKKDIESWLAI